MTNSISIRAFQADEWRAYRDLRLRSLAYGQQDGYRLYKYKRAE